MDKQKAGEALVAFFGSGSVDSSTGAFTFGPSTWTPKDGGDALLASIVSWGKMSGLDGSKFSAQLYGVSSHFPTQLPLFELVPFADQLLIVNNQTGQARPHDAGLVRRNPMIAAIELLTDGD